MIRNSAERYGVVTQLLHWLVMVLIVVQFVLGKLAERAGEQGDPAGLMEQFALLTRHKSFGITIFALAVARLAWRAISPGPAWPDSMSPIERALARAAHWMLYALLLLMPVAGWLMSSAANFPVSYFRLFTLPDLVGPNEELEATFEAVHHLGANALLLLIVVHVGAALKHHFWDGDNVLLGMLPFVTLRGAGQPAAGVPGAGVPAAGPPEERG